MRAPTGSASTTFVSISTPASAWRSASADTTDWPFAVRAAEKIVSDAPAARATSMARSTALAAVLDPSVPTRILRYIRANLPARMPKLFGWPAGFGEFGRCRLEALDRPEDDLLLAAIRL